MMRLLLAVGAQVALLLLCHALAAPHWSRVVAAPADLLAAPAGELSAFGLHLGAVAAAWWILLGTVHDVVVSVLESRHGRRGRGHRLAPRWVQRFISQTVGTALVISVAAGPAAASTAGAPVSLPAMAQVVAPPVPLVEHAEPSAEPAPPRPAPTDVGEDGDAPDDPGGGPGGEPTTEQGPPLQPGPVVPDREPDLIHTVAAGENLWVIARGHLSAAGGTPLDREVHAHWLQLIAQNQSVLISGDPDLIFPGERLQLPAVGVGAGTAVRDAQDAADAPSDGAAAAGADR